jgi:hypothetical protein
MGAPDFPSDVPAQTGLDGQGGRFCRLADAGSRIATRGHPPANDPWTCAWPSAPGIEMNESDGQTGRAPGIVFDGRRLNLLPTELINRTWGAFSTGTVHKLKRGMGAV